MTPAQTVTSMSIFGCVAVETSSLLCTRGAGFQEDTWGGGSLKRNLISGIELRSAHSHQPQKLRSALVTGPTEAQLTYSLPVCTAVLHLSVVCLYLFFSCTSSLCSCQLHNGLTPRDQHTGHDQLPTTLSL